MKFLRKYADNTISGSVSNKFRLKRMALFNSIIKEIPCPVKILDVGGTINFWEKMNLSLNAEVSITILNIEEEVNKNDKFTFIKGSATDLGRFKENEFDMVFSNSVIEHVGNYAEQKKMAEEIIRTGRKYFVQTPNYFFPMEPHFLFPFFQFMPTALRIFLVRNFNMGWFRKAQSRSEALELVSSVNLLKKSELQNLFSKGILVKEKFLWLTKSFMIHN